MRPSALAALCSIAMLASKAYAGGYDVPECTADSDVVGRQRRSRFGSAWDVQTRPRAVFRFGGGLANISTTDMAIRGNFIPGAAFAIFPGQQSVGSIVSGGTMIGVTMFAFDRFYLGGELGFGGGQSALMTGTGQNNANVITGNGYGFRYLGASFLFGAAFALGALQIRGELAVGLVGYTFDTIISEARPIYVTTGGTSQWTLSPRIAASYWITPWVSAGAAFGLDVLHLSSVSANVFLEFHARGFDAMRSDLGG